MSNDVITEEVVKDVYRIAERISKSDIYKLVDGTLLEGKPSSEYENIGKVFNTFIIGAAEGREIKELTKAYKGLDESISELSISPKENNQLLYSIYDVATEAEMQGFIYGFKMFNSLLNMSLREKGAVSCG